MNKALDLLLNSRRIDLISKYLYIKNPTNNYFKEVYLAFINAFNGFLETPNGENYTKQSKEDFLNSFNELYASISKNGFNERKAIPINNGEICDGAHRLAVCAVLNIDITRTDIGEQPKIYDYKFFQKKSIDTCYLDFCALEYVKLNPNAYIVNLHAVNNPQQDKKVEEILEKYGFIYYKKDVHLSFNGYVNIKKLSYGFDNWGEKSWIGSAKNNYAGAQRHAKKSFGLGKNPLRAFIFVCKNFDNVLKAKAEIRDIYKIGNESVHINDTRKEAIELAQTYFNDNSISMFNARPFNIDTPTLDEYLKELKLEAINQNTNIENICATGSSPMAVYALREIKDFDYLIEDTTNFHPQNNNISEHDGVWLSYYPLNKRVIIENPQFHFYYKGVKFITLDILKKMKKKRNEIPKDIKDIKLIEKIEQGKFKYNKLKFMLPKFIKKYKYGRKRTITIFNLIKISYKKKIVN